MSKAIIHRVLLLPPRPCDCGRLIELPMLIHVEVPSLPMATRSSVIVRVEMPFTIERAVRIVKREAVASTSNESVRHSILGLEPPAVIVARV